MNSLVTVANGFSNGAKQFGSTPPHPIYRNVAHCMALDKNCTYDLTTNILLFTEVVSLNGIT